MVKILTKNDYLKLIENQENLIVLRFHASWCQPCKVLAETIKNIEPVEGVEFAEVDVDEVEEELVNEFNIRNVPVLIFVKNGLQVDRNVGVLTAESLLNKIEANKNK